MFLAVSYCQTQRTREQQMSSRGINCIKGTTSTRSTCSTRRTSAADGETSCYIADYVGNDCNCCAPPHQQAAHQEPCLSSGTSPMSHCPVTSDTPQLSEAPEERGFYLIPQHYSLYRIQPHCLGALAAQVVASWCVTLGGVRRGRHIRWRVDRPGARSRTGRRGRIGGRHASLQMFLRVLQLLQIVSVSVREWRMSA